jgi:hypothetical protein
MQTTTTLRTSVVIDNLVVYINGNFADITVEPLGHVLINADETELRPITKHCAVRLLSRLRHQPREALALIERIERIAKIVYPDADEHVDWLWELPELPAQLFCPHCAC